MRPEVSGYYSLYQWLRGEEAPANDSLGVLVPPLALFHSTATGHRTGSDRPDVP